MYSTCLFCHGPLGGNDAVEHFPVGCRLAFDPEKGRLWAICPRCARWNLAPLEERWEAVEDCERIFRGTRLRVATDNVGMAQVSERLDLVRIGRPARRELATWRYGGDFLQRRQRFSRWTRVVDNIGRVNRFLIPALLLPAIAGAGQAALVGLGVGALVVGSDLAWGHGVALRVAGPRGAVLRIRRRHLRVAQLIDNGSEPSGVMLRVRHADGATRLSGDVARRALASILARVNWTGADRGLIERAVGLVDEAPEPRAFVRRAVQLARRPDQHRWREAQRRVREDVSDSGVAWNIRYQEAMPNFGLPDGSLHHLLPSQRLALEMAVHEDAERRAIVDGELAALEAAWREAEEIAHIADNLLVSSGVEDFIRRHRQT